MRQWFFKKDMLNAGHHAGRDAALPPSDIDPLPHKVWPVQSLFSGCSQRPSGMSHKDWGALLVRYVLHARAFLLACPAAGSCRMT